MAYQFGDHIGFKVREILLYGLTIGVIFFGFGWVSRPALDKHVALIADEEPMDTRYVQGEYKWVFYRERDGKLHQALAKMYYGPGSPLGYPKLR